MPFQGGCLGVALSLGALLCPLIRIARHEYKALAPRLRLACRRTSISITVIMRVIAPPCKRFSIAYFSTTSGVPLPTRVVFETSPRGLSREVSVSVRTLSVVEKYATEKR